MSSSNSQSIAIAGAGLLGRLLAWQLLMRGHKVTLYEAGELAIPPAAAWTAAGMISPLSEAVVSDYSIYRMGLFALEQWPRWLAQLSDAPRAQSLFKHRGSLLVAHPQDLSELEQFSQELRYILPEQRGYRAVDGPEIQKLEPDLSTQFQQGLLLEDEGHIDNRNLLRTLLAEIRQLRGECIEHCPVEVAPGEVIQAAGSQAFDLVIDCRGIGAKPREPRLRGVRGEVLAVQTKEVSLQRPVRLMHPRYQLYIVPKLDNCFVIGATQIESEDRSPVTLQSSLELGSALYTLSPAFAEARIIDLGVNLRPAFMDNMPHVRLGEGLISANGLFRHGYLLAPALVCHILAHLDNAPDTLFANDLKPVEGE
jgi:glycine oxidase